MRPPLRTRLILVVSVGILLVLLVPAASSASAPNDARTTGIDALCGGGPCWISLGKYGTGTGLVTSEPEGMHCGATCLAPFFHGTWATLVATPDAGSRFTRWEAAGCQPANALRCTVWMDDGKTIKAVFDLAGAADSPVPILPPSPPPPPPAAAPPAPPPSPGSPSCTIIGTGGNDELDGTGRRDVICGLGGDDHIHSGGGNDIVRAGAGADEVEAGAGADLIDGGPGADALFGDGGHDRLTGGGGRDVLSGGAGADTLILKDAVGDIGRGGSGLDRARADKLDRLIAVERRF